MLYIQLKSNENEVKYTDLRRKIEIKKMTNLTRNEILYFMYACFHVIEVYITNTEYHNNMNCSPKNERSGYKRSTMQ